MPAPSARILAPIRYSAWMAGELGHELEKMLTVALDRLPAARIHRLPRGFIIEADEAPGPLLEAVCHAMQDLEAAVHHAYPVFHREMGPVWSRTLQAVFP